MTIVIPQSIFDLKDPKYTVYWRHIPKGAFGWPVFVPAEYISTTKKRILVKVRKKDGDFAKVAVHLHELRLFKKGVPNETK